MYRRYNQKLEIKLNKDKFEQGKCLHLHMMKKQVKNAYVTKDNEVAACQEPILQGEHFQWNFDLAISLMTFS
mgnify:CR=1 FL=1